MRQRAVVAASFPELVAIATRAAASAPVPHQRLHRRAGVAEVLGDCLRALFLDEVSTQRLIAALIGLRRRCESLSPKTRHHSQVAFIFEREASISISGMAIREPDPDAPAEQQVAQRDRGDRDHEHDDTDRTVENIYDAADLRAVCDCIGLGDQ